MSAMKNFFSSLQWWKLEAHDELLHCTKPRCADLRELGQTAPPELTYWCLAEPGQQYVLYIRGTIEPVELSLEGDINSLKARQWNPRTGDFSPMNLTLENGKYIYNPPDTQDWVVVLTSTR